MLHYRTSSKKRPQGFLFDDHTELSWTESLINGLRNMRVFENLMFQFDLEDEVFEEDGPNADRFDFYATNNLDQFRV